MSLLCQPATVGDVGAAAPIATVQLRPTLQPLHDHWAVPAGGNYFTELCSDSEEGVTFRVSDSEFHTTPSCITKLSGGGQVNGTPKWTSRYDAVPRRAHI